MAKPVTHMFLAFGAVVIAAAGLAYVILGFAPDKGGAWPLAAVYILVFTGSYGAALFAGYAVRITLWRGAVRSDLVRASNRQAVLIGFLTVAILMLQAGKVFNLWSAGLLFLIFVLLELYIQ